VTKELDAAVLKAVAPNPDLRYQSMAALAGDLRAIASALELDDVEEMERAEVPSAVNLGRMVLMTIAILAAVAVVMWWVTQS
jgi:hypothetical protein